MGKNKKFAVMYGAGNIGRGFIGQVFHDSGFEVVFIDVNKDLVSALNEKGSYTQLIIEGEGDGNRIEQREISGVRAIDGLDFESVAREIAACDIMAVSVGAAALSQIAPFIAGGLTRRKAPLNILVCENQADAPKILRGGVLECLSEHLSESSVLSDSSALNRVGFVGASIGRMVPVVPISQRLSDPTLIAVEKFCNLPIDGDAIIEPMPKLMFTTLCSPFAFEEDKKLYIHNMSHSLAAYLGALKGYKYIWQAMDDESVRVLVQKAMNVSADALVRKYNKNEDDLSRYVADLLIRFGNKGLGDTVKRVGGDPLRKLAPNDRLIGTLDLCKEQGLDYSCILSGVAAALQFYVPDDPSAGQLQKRLKESGRSTFLRDYCGLSEADIERCLGMRLHK